MKVHDFQKMKESGKKISVVTCYDYWSAHIISYSNIDCVLVGDSLAMVMYGYPTTLSATVDMIARHVEAVSKGCPGKFIIADMPFLSYRKDLAANMSAIEAMMRSGAHAIKLERADGNLALIEHVVQSGIPVMGHVGLTPQSFYTIGGFVIQGKEQKGAEKLKEDARQLTRAGCFSLVLECIPSVLAQQITDEIPIPTIGIGAGPDTSGQVLVLHDLLGLTPFTPKYLKKFLDGFTLIKDALNSFDREVKTSAYPQVYEHTY